MTSKKQLQKLFPYHPTRTPLGVVGSCVLIAILALFNALGSSYDGDYTLLLFFLQVVCPIGLVVQAIVLLASTSSKRRLLCSAIGLVILLICTVIGAVL